MELTYQERYAVEFKSVISSYFPWNDNFAFMTGVFVTLRTEPYPDTLNLFEVNYRTGANRDKTDRAGRRR